LGIIARGSAAQKAAILPPAAFAHVPAGIPVALSNLSLVHDDDGNAKKPRFDAITFRIAGLAAQRLTRLNFTLFEFDAKGALRRVSGFTNEQEGLRQAGEEIRLPYERRLDPADRLVLAVESAGGDDRTWEVDFTALAKQAANIAKGKPLDPPSIKELAAREADFGSAFCLNGIRRGRALAQPATPDERPAKITSYACDQTRRSFAFEIFGKNL
jgi:hypothetical protein